MLPQGTNNWEDCLRFQDAFKQISPAGFLRDQKQMKRDVPAYQNIFELSVSSISVFYLFTKGANLQPLAAPWKDMITL